MTMPQKLLSARQRPYVLSEENAVRNLRVAGELRERRHEQVMVKAITRV